MGKRENPLHWMPHSVDFWLGELAGGMRADQKGALMDLLSIAWQQQPPCTLPDDDAFLATRSGLGAKWKASRGVILARFVATDDGRLMCGWLRDVYDEQHTKYTNRSSANRLNRLGTKGKTDGDTNPGTNRGTNGRQNREGALPLQGKEPLPAELAPAPEGAAQPAGTGGNYFDSPSAREALHRRGVRDEQIDRSPMPDIATVSAETEFRQTQYDAELEAGFVAFKTRFPQAIMDIGAECRRDLRLPDQESRVELSNVQLLRLRAAVIEVIRQRCQWPTVNAWDGNQFPPIPEEP